MNGLSKGLVTWTEIGTGAEGQRIDNYLLKTLKGVPKSHIYRILRSGEVRVNSRRVDATYRLEAGDRLRIPPVRTARRVSASAASGPKLASRPLLEDDYLLAV
ncbi:MAG: S4 domain-containing protein, partial [Burkholderiales bacterium]